MDRIASEFNGSETVYRLTLQGETGALFEVAAVVSDQLAVTQPGDRVELQYVEGEGTIHCTGFENLTLR